MSETQDLPPPNASLDPLPAPTVPPVPSLKSLQSWLPLYAKRADKTITQLSRIFSTPSGTDKFLLVLGYSSLAASSILKSISLHSLQNAARKLVSAVTSLPPNTTVIIDTAAIRTPRLLRLSQSLKALSDLIGDFRIFVRLWGLLGIWQWGKSLLNNPPADLTLKRIAWAQVFVNVLYQYLENVAYLASKGVLGWSAERQGRAWVWSSRFWAAHVGLEFWRLGYERAVRQAQRKKIENENLETKEHLKERTATAANSWSRDMVVNLAYAPLTVHWSLEKGFIGDMWVGVLGTAAGAAGLAELWKDDS